ncbi:MAG TPA: RES domain-containing protein [Polyangiaceae bacterium]|nr:RES domain-containing protein [Polyangiaceae bacterium]
MAGGIDPTRYQTLYDAFSAALRGSVRIPLFSLPVRSIIFRSVAADYKGMAPTKDTARTIYGGATTTTNRWTGQRGSLRPGIGGLYVSVHLDAMSNEVFHYGKGAGSSIDALTKTRTFRFETERPLFFTDLALGAGRANPFLSELGETSSVKAALRATGLNSVYQGYSHPTDYSMCRALGHALLDANPLTDGLRVTTARDEYAKIVGETSENLVIYDKDSIPLPYLKPLTETVYGKAPDGRLTQTVKRL